MFKRIRTPHGNAMSHFAKMFAFFSLASFFVLVTDFGINFTASVFAAIPASFAIGLATLLGGIFSTMILRTLFNLAQTGRILQYLSFTLVATMVLAISCTALPSILQPSNVLAGGMALFVIAFLPATLTGVVPYKKRTWLPIPHKPRI